MKLIDISLPKVYYIYYIKEKRGQELVLFVTHPREFPFGVRKYE